MRVASRGRNDFVVQSNLRYTVKNDVCIPHNHGVILTFFDFTQAMVRSHTTTLCVVHTGYVYISHSPSVLLRIGHLWVWKLHAQVVNTTHRHVAVLRHDSIPIPKPFAA